MKYLIYEASCYPWDVYLFPVTLSHFEMDQKVGRGRPVVSAGKVSLGRYEGHEESNRKLISAIPGSTSLRPEVKWSKERQEEDNRIIRMQFDE